MYKIYYNSDPNEALDNNHRASFLRCTVQDVKAFILKEEAVRFWFDCTAPITKLHEIIPCSKEIIELYENTITEFDISLVTDKYLNTVTESSDAYIANF